VRAVGVIAHGSALKPGSRVVLEDGTRNGSDASWLSATCPIRAAVLLTRREAAAALGMSLNHFERHVQQELKDVLCGELVLLKVGERERRVQRHAHDLVEASVRPLRASAAR
jgi:hypothetical protein